MLHHRALSIDQPDPQYAKPLDLTALDNIVEIAGSVSFVAAAGRIEQVVWP